MRSKLFALALVAAAAGCSSNGPLEEARAATDDLTTTTIASVEDVETDAPASLAFDEDAAAAAIEQLDSEEGRAAFVTEMSMTLGIPEDKASCFLDNTPPESLATIGKTAMTAEEITQYLEILDTCDIALSDLGQFSMEGMGGAAGTAGAEGADEDAEQPN